MVQRILHFQIFCSSSSVCLFIPFPTDNPSVRNMFCDDQEDDEWDLSGETIYFGL